MKTSIIELNNAIKERTYLLETTIKLRVKQQYFENKITTIAKQTFIAYQEEDYDEDGHYTPEGLIIQVDILDFKQTADDELNLLFAEINQATEKVVARTDNYGVIQEIINIAEIVDKWQKLKPLLMAKHKNKPGVQAFFDGFEKQFTQVGEIEYALENRGIYAFVFNGFYDRDFGDAYGFTFDHYKTIHHFFGQVDLPLLINYKIIPDNSGGVEIVSNKTALNHEEFKPADFNTFIKNLSENLRADTGMALNNHESYLLDQNGWIKEARQHLKVEVAGIYLSEQEQLLKQQ